MKAAARRLGLMIRNVVLRDAEDTAGKDAVLGGDAERERVGHVSTIMWSGRVHTH